MFIFWIVVSTWFSCFWRNRTLYNLLSKDGGFFSEGVKQSSSIEELGFKPIRFCSDKAISFSNWTCHFFFIKFQVISSPQILQLPPIYFWAGSLEIWEGKRVYVKSMYVSCLCVRACHEETEFMSNMSWTGQLKGGSEDEFITAREMESCFHQKCVHIASGHTLQGLLGKEGCECDVIFQTFSWDAQCLFSLSQDVQCLPVGEKETA